VAVSQRSLEQDAQETTAQQGADMPALSTRHGLVEITPQLMQEDALVVSHVSKRFYKQRSMVSRLKGLARRGSGKGSVRVVRAVEDVTLTVKRREIFGVLGSNGSGKSTFIRLISTLLEPDEGTVRIFGYDVQQDERRVQQLINRVSVDAAFFKKLSPYENLIYAARLYGMPGERARQEIYALLTRLGIKPDRISQGLENMSRGMQQKVAIARAFLTAPVLLLLDEPTTGLDPRSKADVQVFVRELRDTHDATILLTTHDMDEADALCDRIAIIDGGRIVAMDTPAELKRQVALLEGKSGPASLHDVFMHYTGRNWEEYEGEEDEEGDDQDESAGQGA
jgi:ABC-2 type transport system ATP-binding protein